jgi:proteic killer suppression protein
MAIRSYLDKGTRDIAAGVNSKRARSSLPILLHAMARRRLGYLAAAESLEDLLAWPGLNLHALTGDRIGQHAIRINDQYRICFLWLEDGIEDVEITDYH